jgi:hypothetical protein
MIVIRLDRILVFIKNGSRAVASGQFVSNRMGSFVASLFGELRRSGMEGSLWWNTDTVVGSVLLGLCRLWVLGASRSAFNHCIGGTQMRLRALFCFLAFANGSLVPAAARSIITLVERRCGCGLCSPWLLPMGSWCQLWRVQSWRKEPKHDEVVSCV